MKNRYGHEIINFPQKQTFKKWILSLSKEERVKLETIKDGEVRSCNCPLAKFMQFYTGKDNIVIFTDRWYSGKSAEKYNLPDWAQEFIKSFDSGQIQNLRQWASQKDS